MLKQLKHNLTYEQAKRRTKDKSDRGLGRREFSSRHLRMTGHSKGAVLKLIAEVGTACIEFHDKNVRNVTSKRVQCDEIWSFCYSKEKNVPADKQGQFGVGDVWTWTAIDADTKLMVSWLVGDRDGNTAYLFMQDLADRLANRVQMTTDGHRVYLEAVEGAFGSEIDYAMLHKDLRRKSTRDALLASRMHRVQGGSDHRES